MPGPWDQWRQPDPRQLCRVSTSSTFTFRWHHECDTWAEAVKVAVSLRATGQCYTKPEVKRIAGHEAGRHQWRVSWIPAYSVTHNAA